MDKMMKSLKVIFTQDRIFFDITKEGQVDRVGDMANQPDVEVTTIAHELARKHGISRDNIEYKSKG